ncbi:MAG: ribosome assembly cofactor RimP [Flavobacteriales bacterium]|nr:MAG: ribosome assembly cofactor RimP [Flavobacteriales bacterium]
MITSKNIRDVVEETLNNDDLYIVEVTVDLNNRIKVILDSDKTVSITDCISVNRAIEQHFDRDEEDFSLEVTSAGLGQPLVLLRQYNKLIGKKLEITVDNGLKLSGELKRVNGEYVELLEEAKKRKAETNEPLLHKLTLGNIKQAKAIITI